MLQLQQQQFPKALESAAEVLNIVPESKHAAALLATAQHKAGKKKQASATVTELCAAFQKADETQMAEELGCIRLTHARFGCDIAHIACARTCHSTCMAPFWF